VVGGCGKFGTFSKLFYFFIFLFSEKGIFNRVFLVVNFCHFEKEYPVINSVLFGEKKVIK
jgi:hypothetical protein